jgi:hypothetical protein
MSECDKFGNLINHMSEHDGTRRSAQACFIIKRFNPKSAVDLANVIRENKLEENIIGWHLPMFAESDRLMHFCKKEAEQHDFYNGKVTSSMSETEKKRKKDWNEWYVTDCVTHADDVDLCADIWKLSPEINKNYPSVVKMYMGTDIGAGWHKFHGDVQTELGER